MYALSCINLNIVLFPQLSERLITQTISFFEWFEFIVTEWKTLLLRANYMSSFHVANKYI